MDRNAPDHERREPALGSTRPGPSGASRDEVAAMDTLVGAAEPPAPASSRAELGVMATLASDEAPVPLELEGELSIDPRFEARYAHRALLGEGGMGTVELHRDRAIGRDVAIKRIKAKLQSGVALARFVREARVQGQLEHPAIVPVHDLGRTEDGAAFFTMKRVVGASLDDILDRLAAGDPETLERFGRHKLLHAFSTVCLAVDFAHARGVLHRDLKPANVMLGEFGEVYVLDWGLARAFSAHAEAEAEAEPAEPRVEPVVGLDSIPGGETVAGTILGTPGYMSPEQCRGEHDRLGPESDVYALGCILFRILHLEELHTGRSATARLASTVTGSALDPARSLRADVAPELERLCREAIALDPRERIPSARALAERLERYLDGERDEARRRTLATEELERALALDGATPSGRTEKMRALGRALALDPSHEGALRALASTLTELPKELPPEALAAVERARAERRGQTVRTSAVRLALWCLFIPIFLALGIVSWPRASVVIGGLVVAALIASHAWRVRATSRGWLLALLALSTVVIGLFSSLLGPFVLVPSLASTNAIFFAASSDRSTRRWVMLASLAVILVPLGASLLGLDATFYTFRDGSMIITSPVVALPATLSLVMLTVVSAMLVVVATLLGGRTQDELARAEEHRILHAHYLAQLVPSAGSGEGAEAGGSDAGSRPCASPTGAPGSAP